MAGSSTAPEDAVRARLVAEFGEKRAAEILGDTTPPKRRKPPPTMVGVKPKPGPALSRSEANHYRGVSWRERNDRVMPPRVRLFTVQSRSGVVCRACGVKMTKGDEAMRLTYQTQKRTYCPPCGAKEVKGDG